jgi:hypothetical protein
MRQDVLVLHVHELNHYVDSRDRRFVLVWFVRDMFIELLALDLAEYAPISTTGTMGRRENRLAAVY